MKKFFRYKFLDRFKTEKLKNEVIQIFKQNNLDDSDINKALQISITAEELSNFKEFKETFFSETFKVNLENFFGNLGNLYIMSFDIQKNNRLYTASRIIGFHRDSGKLNQNKIINKKKNIYFKVGVYFQNNSKLYGGGIDLVKPLFLEKYFKGKIGFQLSNIFFLIRTKFFNYHFNTSIGDMIGFCGTVFHRTSPIKKKIANLLDDKYSIYFNICNKNILQDLGISESEIENNTKILNFDNYKINSLNKDICDKIRKIISD